MDDDAAVLGKHVAGAVWAEQQSHLRQGLGFERARSERRHPDPARPGWCGGAWIEQVVRKASLPIAPDADVET